MSIVNGFRAQRLALGLTMQELSDLSGLSLYLIRRCEEGQAEHITLSKLLTLSAALASPLKKAAFCGRSAATAAFPCAMNPATFWNPTWPTGT